MKHNKIKDFPEQLRPRERFFSYSASNLSDYELLAILLQSGSAKLNALELAQEVLCRAGSLQGLKKMGKAELCQIHGIGEGKAAAILSLVEIAKRMSFEEIIEDPEVMNTPRRAVAVFELNLKKPHQEVFQAAYLDAKLNIVACEEVFVGTVNYSLVHLRDVFRNAVKHNAHSIIVGHNHPSGDVSPSKEDRGMTEKLVDAGKLMGIPVHDHIIFNTKTDAYFSFKEKALI